MCDKILKESYTKNGLEVINKKLSRKINIIKIVRDSCAALTKYKTPDKNMNGEMLRKLLIIILSQNWNLQLLCGALTHTQKKQQQKKKI